MHHLAHTTHNAASNRGALKKLFIGQLLAKMNWEIRWLVCTLENFFMAPMRVRSFLSCELRTAVFPRARNENIR
jgi:hypothetical protein